MNDSIEPGAKGGERAEGGERAAKRYLAYFRVVGQDLYLCPRNGPDDFMMCAGSSKNATTWPSPELAEKTARRFAEGKSGLDDLVVRPAAPGEAVPSARELTEDAPWRRRGRGYRR